MPEGGCGLEQGLQPRQLPRLRQPRGREGAAAAAAGEQGSHRGHGLATRHGAAQGGVEGTVEGEVVVLPPAVAGGWADRPGARDDRGAFRAPAQEVGDQVLPLPCREPSFDEPIEIRGQHVLGH